MTKEIRREITTFHKFLQDWIAGRVEKSVFLALYEELQIEEGKKNRRLSLAVFTKRPGSKRVTWLHCHESRLPSGG